MFDLLEIARGRRIVAVAAREMGLTRSTGRPKGSLGKRILQFLGAC